MQFQSWNSLFWNILKWTTFRTVNKKKYNAKKSEKSKEKYWYGKEEEKERFYKRKKEIEKEKLEKQIRKEKKKQSTNQEANNAVIVPVKDNEKVTHFFKPKVNKKQDNIQLRSPPKKKDREWTIIQIKISCYKYYLSHMQGKKNLL